MRKHSPAVLLSEVTKVFTGRSGPIQVFEGMELAVPAGALLALVGANGSGKSTLIRLIAGLVLPDAGTVRVCDRRGALVDPARQPGTCAATLDGGRGLYGRLTIAENLRYLAALNGIEPAAGVRAAAPWLERFGLWTRRGDMVQTLSKGTQHKVALAAALANAAPLLLLDEPTTLLDDASCALLADILREVRAKGRTIIVATHDREFIVRCTAACLEIGTISGERRDGVPLACSTVDTSTGAPRMPPPPPPTTASIGIGSTHVGCNQGAKT